VPAIKGDMYINTHCNYSQPTLIKLDNENIGGHLTHLHLDSSALKDAVVDCSTTWDGSEFQFQSYGYNRKRMAECLTVLKNQQHEM